MTVHNINRIIYIYFRHRNDKTKENDNEQQVQWSSNTSDLYSGWVGFKLGFSFTVIYIVLTEKWLCNSLKLGKTISLKTFK